MAMRMFGAGGSKPKTPAVRTPVEAKNTLQSRNIARIIDALCEGPIKGLVNGNQSIYFDDTVLENEDGTFNFEGVTVETRIGEPDQEPLAGFPYIEKEVSVGVEIKFGIPVVRTIQDPDVDFAMVKIRIPQLSKTNQKTGDVTGSSVKLNIEVRPSGGNYQSTAYGSKWQAFTSSRTATSTATGLRFTANADVSGQAGSKINVLFTAQYKKTTSSTWITSETRSVTVQIATKGNPGAIYKGNASASFEILNLASSQYDVCVLAEGGASKTTLVNQSELIATPLLIEGKNTSPYEIAYRIALPDGGAPWDIRVSRLTEDSDKIIVQNQTYFSSYTEVTDVKMIYPDTALVGVTVDAESFGQDVPARSYEIYGRYTLIPTNYDPDTRTYTGIWDGTFKTGWTQNPAWILMDVLIDKRAGLGQSIDQLQVDKFELYDISQYCDELVDDGFGGKEPRFQFNGIINSAREAYDVVNSVTQCFRGRSFWGTGSISFFQDRPADISKSVTPANVIDGEFKYSGAALKDRHTAVLVSWNDPQDGYRSNIAVIEDIDGINEYGWRQLDAGAFYCTSLSQATRFGKWILDTERNETETVTYRASLDHADVLPGQIIAIADPFYADVRYGGRCLETTTTGTVVLDKGIVLESSQAYTIYVTMPDGTLEERNVSNDSDDSEQSILELDTLLPIKPIPGAVWMVSATNLKPRLFRVISIREADINEFEITALFHDPNKYDRVEKGLNIVQAPYSLFPTGPLKAPTNLTILEYLYTIGQIIKSSVTLSWTASEDTRVSYYEIYYKVDTQENYTLYRTTASTSVDIQDLSLGFYSFRVRAISGFGTPSGFLEGTKELQGLLAPPSDVQNFSINIIGGQAYLSWDPNTDLDLSYYKIKTTPNTINPSWGGSSTVIEKVSKDSVSVTLPVQAGAYLIKAVDSSDIESTNATIINTTIATVEGLNFVHLETEDPTFGGVFDRVLLAGDGLELGGTDSVDDYINVDEAPNFDIGTRGLTTLGYYYFENYFDLGSTFTSRLTPFVSATGADQYGNMDLWQDVDQIENWDGDDPGKWQTQVEISYTNDNPASSPVWSDWKPLIVGDYTARAFKWRLQLSSQQAGITPHVNQLAVQVDMPDRTEGQNDLICPTSGLNVSFAAPFREIPAVTISAQDLDEGDNYILSNKTESGFRIEFTNGGTSISRTFDYIAKGWGYLRT